MKAVNDNYKPVGSHKLASLISNKLAVSSIALLTAFAAVQTAWATIDNTVTATGDSPSGGPDDVTAQDTESVDVVDADPGLTVTKTADVTTNVAVGATITYTYTVTNTGNVTLNNVSLTDVHEGTGTAPTPGSMTLTDNGGGSTDNAADQIYDSLGLLDVVTWTSTYVVTQADVDNQLDNDLDNTVTVSATPAAGAFDGGDDLDDTEEVDLEDNPSLAITKVATLLDGAPLADPLTANATVGQVITYTYTVTNDGNVPVSNITLSDAHGGSGPAPTPVEVPLSLVDNGVALDSSDASVDNSWDVLGPLDVVTFTGTYTVTQTDVDNQ